MNALMLAWLWSAYGAATLVVSLALACMKPYMPPFDFRLIVAAMALAELLVTSWAPPRTLVASGLGGDHRSRPRRIHARGWGLLQEKTPEELRGRVFSVLNTGAMSASMLGMVGFGWMADRLGPVMSLMGMTAVFAITAGVTLLLGRFGEWNSRTA